MIKRVYMIRYDMICYKRDDQGSGALKMSCDFIWQHKAYIFEIGLKDVYIMATNLANMAIFEM